MTVPHNRPSPAPWRGGAHGDFERDEVQVPQAIDTYTSAPWFDGFRETIVVRGIAAMPRPITAAHTWMLTIGWRRHGLLSVHDVPAVG